jgi:hypothetical protein
VRAGSVGPARYDAGQFAAKSLAHLKTLDGAAFDQAYIDREVPYHQQVPHTATSKAGGFDSKMIQAGESWTYTAGTTGEFA